MNSSTTKINYNEEKQRKPKQRKKEIRLIELNENKNPENI